MVLFTKDLECLAASFCDGQVSTEDFLAGLREFLSIDMYP